MNKRQHGTNYEEAQLVQEEVCVTALHTIEGKYSFHIQSLLNLSRELSPSNNLSHELSPSEQEIPLVCVQLFLLWGFAYLVTQYIDRKEVLKIEYSHSVIHFSFKI